MTTLDATATSARRRRPGGSRRPSPTALKLAMAASGAFLLLYVVVHLIGNLKLFLGEGPLDHYAEWLRDLGEPLLPRTVFLWGFRLVLILAFVVHVRAAYLLTRLNRSARPVHYRSRRQWVVASYASRTMVMSGVIVGLFVVYHLLDLTWGPANPDFVQGRVHANIVASFSRWPVALVYVIGNVALGLHLAHGVWSMTQTVGADSPAWERARRGTSVGVASVIVAGNVSMPVAVLAGWVS